MTQAVPEMGTHDVGRRLLAGVAVMSLAAGCAGTASMTSTLMPTREATLASATSSAAPIRTPTPTPTAAPTIGEPADDGARIIAIDTNPSHLLVPTTRARDLTIKCAKTPRCYAARLTTTP